MVEAPDPKTDYDAFVRHVAKNAMERDGSNWKHVANVVVSSVQYHGERLVVPAVAEPYSDRRIDPMAVLRQHTDEELGSKLETLSLREAAVIMFGHDLKQAWDEIQSEPELSVQIDEEEGWADILLNGEAVATATLKNDGQSVEVLTIDPNHPEDSHFSAAFQTPGDE